MAVQKAAFTTTIAMTMLFIVVALSWCTGVREDASLELQHWRPLREDEGDDAAAAVAVVGERAVYFGDIGRYVDKHLLCSHQPAL